MERKGWRKTFEFTFHWREGSTVPEVLNIKYIMCTTRATYNAMLTLTEEHLLELFLILHFVRNKEPLFIVISDNAKEQALCVAP